ncbi:MAG: ROK family protein [Acidobacteriota bacterium]
MQLLGIHVAERRVTAVAVDGDGTVLRRAQHIGDNPADHVRDLVAGIAGDRPFDAAGFASHLPDAPIGLDNQPWLASGSIHVSTPGAAAVTAETWAGAARGARHAICLWIGEQVFAGILLDGTPWAGAHGLAGSAAWLALNPVERQDYRKFGSLAAEVSNTGIARRLSWRIQAGDHSAVLERAGDLESITSLHVFDGARSGDGVSISVVRDTAKYIGMAAANLATAIDPEIIVLGGEAAAAGDLLLDPVRHECARRLPPGMVEPFRLEISPLGEDGVAIGAARLAALARA